MQGRYYAFSPAGCGNIYPPLRRYEVAPSVPSSERFYGEALHDYVGVDAAMPVWCCICDYRWCQQHLSV
jgi:hypothetical protein